MPLLIPIKFPFIFPPLFFSPDAKFYEEVRDLPKLTGVLNDILDNYNVTFPTQMNLVFFVDALSHAVRISRILRQPRGERWLLGCLVCVCAWLCVCVYLFVCVFVLVYVWVCVCVCVGVRVSAL